MSARSLRSKRSNKAPPLRRDLRPLIGKSFNSRLNCKECLTTNFFIDFYMKMCRGLQLRNWLKVRSQLVQMKAPKDVIQIAYNSWVTFKLARALRPKQSSIYVYIMKNFSSLEGQKIYDEVYEQYTDQPFQTSWEFYKLRGKDSRYFRLLEYFYNEQPEWILPLVVFPRIDFEKSKMHLCFEDYDLSPEKLKEVHEKVFSYVYNLGIEQLFMPRAEVMQKYSNQRYNDGGVVRFDYERPKNSFDSSFKYQRFLTQPLTPREVWLPGKAIKQNNAFMMAVHRQILEKDPVYPSTLLAENLERLSPYMKDGFMKFDISGFGLQYTRALLTAGNRAIQELFPCSVYDEQSNIMEQILDSVAVEMPSGEIVYPKRGIGLGYYEDLKTIVMLALLQDSKPISVYGDQGLIDPFSVSFAEDLMSYSFIMNWEKVDFGSSEGKTRWGGCSFTEDSVVKPMLYMEGILGAFFSRHHWERKLSLMGFAKHYPEVYKSVEKRLIDMYDRIFGFEFFKGDNKTSFLNGGISSGPRNVGHLRLWSIRSMMSPINGLVFDTVYQTPFKLAFGNQVSNKESLLFQKKRKKLYRDSYVTDSILYDYINPVIEYNKKITKIPRSLPRWADLQLIIYHGISSGSLTCGLNDEDIVKAVVYQHLSPDPFRARATGGYSIETKWRTGRPPSQEWLQVASALIGMNKADSLYVKRADLPQNPALMDDPMYVDSNLFSYLHKDATKRKHSGSVVSTEEHDKFGNTVASEIRNILPHLIKRQKVNNLETIVSLVEKRIEDYDKDYNVAESDYGDYASDDLFFSDAIDMVDLI